jgi:hypothetical protein
MKKRGLFVNKVLEFIGTTILKKVLHIAYNGKERDTLHVWVENLRYNIHLLNIDFIYILSFLLRYVYSYLKCYYKI